MWGSSKHLGGSNSVVECQLPKLDVASSTLVSRSNFSINYKSRSCGRVQTATHHAQRDIGAGVGSVGAARGGARN